MKQALTLVELIISVSIFMIVILAAVSFDIAGRQVLNSTERKSKLLNEASFIVEHIQKNVSQARGDADTSPVTYASNVVTLKRDTITSGTYTYNSANNTLTYTPYTAGTAGTAEILTNRCVGFMVNTGTSCALALNILQLRWDPANATVSPRDNPQITILGRNLYVPECTAG